MSERREYFRVRTLARVALRALSKDEAERLRPGLHARPGAASTSRWLEEQESAGAELRPLLEGLRRISASLERIERRIERLERSRERGAESGEPVEISLSGAGFAGPFELELEPEQLAWVELELPGSGLGPIQALARPVRRPAGEREAAFRFEDIHAEDREQLIQLALRIQSQQLRAEREGAR